MPQNSKTQWSRIAVYWAVLTFGLALFWSVALNLLQLSGMGPAVTLVVPGFLGAIIAILYYRTRVHQTLEYDDNGYLITKGRRKLQEHTWSEFKETSLLKDSYGQTKVRVYRERDGEHYEIDSKACGVNPLNFRDFIATRINVDSQGASNSQIFAGLEREIQKGRAYWVADLNETFRSYQIAGEVFPLMARGSTRPKGFLLSRFVATTLMPNYEVALYAHELSGFEAKSRMMHLIRVIETMRDQKNIKWSWLLLFCTQEPPDSVVRAVQEFGNQDIGLGCIDISTGKLVVSRNQLGRSLGNQMRLNRLIRDLNRRRK
jgi:hypothetical protein